MGTIYKTAGTVKSYGSCNFCRRGIPRKDGKGLDFPYEKVVAIWSNENGSPWVRFCEDCFNELKTL